MTAAMVSCVMPLQSLLLLISSCWTVSVVCCLQIPGSEKILETVSGADRGNKLANLLKKTGLTKAAMSSFGEPELLDDLADHWNAGNHKEVCC